MNYSKQYADAVKSGEIVAGKKIKQATKRTLRDFRAQKKDDFLYYFNEELAAQAIEFVELMPARDGSDLHLELFQKYMISELFGWRLKDNDTRRFDRAFISMARKSGKSYLMSSIAAIYLLLENKPAKNREIVFTANSIKQAHLAFDTLASGLRQVAKKSPSLRKRLKINRLEILDLETDSKAIPLASELDNLDGYQSDLAIIDEFAKAKTKDIYDVLKSGQINSDNSLLAVISTSGNDLNSPMYAEYQFVEKILKNEEQSDRYFVAIWEQDYKNETFKPETWEKSNPLLANPEREKIIRPKLQTDVDLASDQGNLLPIQIKNFNLWLMARKNSYISWSPVNKIDNLNRDFFVLCHD
jgi:phage terminase large subunit-like protein